MRKTSVTIIGGGITGLSVGARLSKNPKFNVTILEKHDVLANETSSHHSGVLHSGVYYPADSLRSKHCLRGKTMLYHVLKENNLPFKQCGKVILSNKTAGCLEKLHSIKMNADKVGVRDLRYLSQRELEDKLPIVNREYFGEALFSPSSGIFDSQVFIRYLESQILNAHGSIRLRNHVQTIQAIDRGHGGYKISVFDENAKQAYTVNSDIIVNAAGLYADEVYSMVEADTSLQNQRKMQPRRGHYYSLALPKSLLKGKLETLVYPVPDKNFKGMSLQLTMDMTGNVSIGPDAEFISRKDDYQFDDSDERFLKFWSAISRYLELSSLSKLSVQEKRQILRPSFVGISGILSSAERDVYRDFIIESVPKLSGFINCIGISSPGLTASLSIAEDVENIINK